MAIKIYEKFAPRANPADGDYPYGSIKNESVPGAKDGTPLDAVWGNDYAGTDAELFAQAGIVPSGDPDKLGASQRVDAMSKLFGRRFASVDDMIAYSGHVAGLKYYTGGTTWEVGTSAIGLLLSSGLYAVPTTSIYAQDFGSNHTEIQRAVNLAAQQPIISTVKLGAGTLDFSVDGLQLPSNRGIIIEGEGFDTLLDSSSATTAFNTIKAPVSVTEKMVLRNFRIAASPIAGSYGLDWSRCRNASYYEGITVDTGANGIYQTESWYTDCGSSYVRNCTGIGFHFYSNSAGTTVNAVTLNGVFANGNGQNFRLESLAGTSTPITIVGGTSEKSSQVSFYVNGFAAVNLVGFYFEANRPTAAAGEIIDLQVDNGSCNVIGGSFQTLISGVASPSAHLVGGTNSTINISDDTFIRVANITNPFSPTSQIHVGRLRGSDYTSLLTRRTSPSVNAGEANTGNLTACKNFLEGTTQPVFKLLTSVNASTTLWTIDFTTVQVNDVWSFEVEVTTAATNATRWGASKHVVSVRKVGASYLMASSLVYDLLGASSNHGTVTISNVGAVVTVSYAPTAGDSYLVKTVLNRFIGYRVTSVN